MPPRSTIETKLPQELRDWLEAELVRAGFSGYRELTEKLNAKFVDFGLELTLSRKAVQKFGKTIEDRVAALKRSTEIARTLAREAGDDEGAINDAVQRIIQDKLFNLVLDLEVDPEKADLVKLGHLAADLGRASVTQKKWQSAVLDRARAVSDKVAAQAKKGGLSPEAVEKIRADILGIGSAS